MSMAVTKDITLPSNVSVTVSNCARLSIASGVTLTSANKITVENAEAASWSAAERLKAKKAA